MLTITLFSSFLWLKFLRISYFLTDIYTSQQKKRYKGLMLNMFYIEKKHRQKSYNLDSYGHKVISTKFLNIIIRTNHGQTEIVMQYGGLRSSVTCVITSCNNDSFASLTHRTNKSLDKGLWDVVPLVHKCVTHLLWCFRWTLTVANTSTEFIS
jgi:hypothetical protein